MTTPETQREPCPDRILDDAGGAFAMGAIFASGMHFIQGTMNSPHGFKLRGGLQNVRMYTPKFAGGFGAWGTTFSTFDCGMVYLRQKEDPWNSILAGAGTGGFLSMRHGVRTAGTSALVGAVFLGLIETLSIVANRHADASMNTHGFPQEDVNGSGLGERVKEGSKWFGGGKKEDVNGSGSGSGSDTTVLESFDTPTPMPNFHYK